MELSSGCLEKRRSVSFIMSQVNVPQHLMGPQAGEVGAGLPWADTKRGVRRHHGIMQAPHKDPEYACLSHMSPQRLVSIHLRRGIQHLKGHSKETPPPPTDGPDPRTDKKSPHPPAR